jgi:hypothetical protein
MGRPDLIGSGDKCLVPRHSGPAAAAALAELKHETPSPNKLAKRFGQNKPRPGGAVERKPVAGRPARTKMASASRTGRK